MNAASIKKTLSEAQKTLAAVAGVVAQVIELGLLHGTALHYAQIVSGAVAAVLVYMAPYTKTVAAPTDVASKV